jgi:hypothetical protein
VASNFLAAERYLGSDLDIKIMGFGLELSFEWAESYFGNRALVVFFVSLVLC